MLEVEVRATEVKFIQSQIFWSGAEMITSNIFAQVEQAVMREVAGSVKSVVTRLGFEKEEEASSQDL